MPERSTRFHDRVAKQLSQFADWLSDRHAAMILFSHRSRQVGAPMKTDPFFRRWKRRYRKWLVCQWALLRLGRIAGQPGEIHELRVTLRRLRIMVRLGAPLLESKAVRAYRAWSRRVTDATSPLRDHDVTVEWLAAQPGTDTIVGFLKSRRQRLWEACRHHLTPPKAAVRVGIARIRSGRKARGRLRRRYVQRVDRLRARVAGQLPRFFDLDLEGRHAFRRTVRQLRYLRELTLPKRKRARDEWLESLNRPQAAMGGHQDLLLAEEILASLPEAKGSEALFRELARQKARGESAIRRGLNQLNQSWIKPERPSPTSSKGTAESGCVRPRRQPRRR
jgi:CHAD domain-containing protein